MESALVSVLFGISSVPLPLLCTSDFKPPFVILVSQVFSQV